LKKILTIAVVLSATTFANAARSADDPAAGAQLYAVHCTACHGADRAGMPGAFPTLIDVGKRLQPAKIKEKISKGGGLMPPFSQLSAQEINDITTFLAK